MDNIERIRDTAHLEELLSEPTEGVIKALGELEGDIVVLGAGGKMGPSLTRMLRRGSDAAGVSRQIFAVSRFSQDALVEQLKSLQIEVIRGDLLEPSFIAKLPQAPNVLFMTGAKFGTSSDPSITWAMNTWLPGLVADHYAGSRITAFSTGNVYPFVPVRSGGSTESDPPAPVGEYAMSALGRERMFQYFSKQHDTPVSIIRLNYAVEMRYGVLVDLATQVMNSQPIDLSMGYANVIWQGDANAMTIQAMPRAESPPRIFNVAGPEIFSVADVCREFGERLDKPVQLIGHPAENALLNNGTASHRLFGAPRVHLATLIQWTADWLARGGETLRKPTHFEVRDGAF